MSRISRCFRIGLRYKYAPETFYISLLQPDGSYKKLDVDTSGYMWGYWLSTGEKEKAIAEVKHFLRSRAKMQKRLVTYGFYLKGSLREYTYFRDAMACVDEYDISEKLELYKCIKTCWEESNSKYKTGATATLNGSYQVERVEDDYVEVDLKRPLKIYVNIR